jgi:hypothetical protein
MQTGRGVDPHIFILDINGEYANAFLDAEHASYQREPNKIYLNGKEFCLPAWMMNGEEICDWLQASEATQEPVLKDWWAIVKGSRENSDTKAALRSAIHALDNALGWLDQQIGKFAFLAYVNHAKEYLGDRNWIELDQLLQWTAGKAEYQKLHSKRPVEDWLQALKSTIEEEIQEESDGSAFLVKSADSPRCVALSEFQNLNLGDQGIDHESNKRIDQYLLTLKLRMRTRLDDRRWQSFFSYEDQNIGSYQDWMGKLGIGRKVASRVSVLDMSMLASEVLPFACALLGRIFLETREMLKPDVRSRYPWLLILEEAHNYARPPRTIEDRAQSLSRRSFERVAKEGRKFGLSLIVASQRPSEISPTIISQCANFFSHRLQNPDDIDHFRRIIPKQAQRLLDQVTVLAAGEAIVFGSAVHVPARVQIKLPAQEPWSATAAPFVDWSKDEVFPLADVAANWGLNDTVSQASADAEPEVTRPADTDAAEADDTVESGEPADDSDEIPF